MTLRNQLKMLDANGGSWDDGDSGGGGDSLRLSIIRWRKARRAWRALEKFLSCEMRFATTRYTMHDVVEAEAGRLW
jgi:hypothetical protein